MPRRLEQLTGHPEPQAGSGGQPPGTEIGALDRIARQASHALSADGAIIFQREAGDDTLRVVSASGCGTPMVGRAFSADGGLAGDAVASGRPILTSGNQRFRRQSPFIADRRTVESAAGPVAANGTVWGALAVFSDSPLSDPADEVLRTIEDFCALTATAVGITGVHEGTGPTPGVAALASLLDLRDGYTSSHNQEVLQLCCALGTRLALDEQQLSDLRIAARLHDLGKIGVPDDILHKPAPLDENEWQIMRQHSVWGADALSLVPGFAHAADAVRGHHERWDGSGYPDGLAGEDIPLSSRIIAVADAYHSMTSNRPYRAALNPSESRQRMLEGRGKQFDPAVVDQLLELVGAGPEAGIASTARETSDAQAHGAPGETRVASRGKTAAARALPEAMARMNGLPALRESRDRLLALLDGGADEAQIISTVESDMALCVAVLRAAATGPYEGDPVCGIPAAVHTLEAPHLRDAVERVPSVDFFQRVPGWTAPLEHLRLHSTATQRAAERIMRAVGAGDRDLVLVAALLHDLGKLVLEHAYPAYPEEVHRDACTADERVSAERRHLGIDHAAIGGFLLRRFDVAGPIARAVEGHHAAHARGPAAVVRLADMLAHYAHAQPVEPKALGEAGRTVGFTPDKLRATMFELSHHTAVTPRAT